MSDASHRVLVALAVLAVMALSWWLLVGDRGTAAVLDGPWQVSAVVDGDTVRVVKDGTEETVRLIGIDTPERDQCGYDGAARFMADQVQGQPVTLVSGATTDRDTYGRLLRYVEHDGVDVGLAQIAAGYAIARYDSRTNQPHPREDLYREVDQRTVHICQ